MTADIPVDVVRWLRDRAESFSRDARILRRDGQDVDAHIYEGVRDELRACAQAVTNDYADHPHTDPGDGRTQCVACGKWVWLVTHSCKGIRVAALVDLDGTHDRR